MPLKAKSTTGHVWPEQVSGVCLMTMAAASRVTRSADRGCPSPQLAREPHTNTEAAEGGRGREGRGEESAAEPACLHPPSTPVGRDCKFFISPLRSLFIWFSDNSLVHSDYSLAFSSLLSTPIAAPKSLSHSRLSVLLLPLSLTRPG